MKLIKSIDFGGITAAPLPKMVANDPFVIVAPIPALKLGPKVVLVPKASFYFWHHAENIFAEKMAGFLAL